MKIRYLGTALAACLLAGCSTSSSDPVAGIAPSSESERSEAQSYELDAPDFVGIYNGNSFETAMGMEVSADGQFRWGLSVGALDLRAAGTWQIEGQEIVLQSSPTPVAPEFAVLGLREIDGQPLVKVVRTDGEAFAYASLRLHCANGPDRFHQIYQDGWSVAIERGKETGEGQDARPRNPICENPQAITVTQSNYNVQSKRLTLADLGWRPGKTVVMEFRANDLGVEDFTGARGRLSDGKLILETELGPLEMRKVNPPDPSGSPADTPLP